MPRRVKYSKELLSPIVAESFSIAEVARKLGLVDKGGTINTLRTKIRLFEIDASHFKGQAWAKGLTRDDPVMTRIISAHTKHTVEASLVDGISLHTTTLTRLLRICGMEYKCVCCSNVGEWLGKPVTLHIDHINGDNRDNRLVNLRYLCPNCHSQTETFGAKNKRPIRDELITFQFGTPKEEKPCFVCDSPTKHKKFCSNECYSVSRDKIDLTADELYVILLQNKMNFSQTSRIVGISDNAIRKRLRKAGIDV